MTAPAESSVRLPIFYTCLFVSLVLIFFFLRIVLVPILLALLLSYLFNPSIEYLERKGFPRSLIVILSIAISLLAISGAIWILVPLLIHQGEVLVDMIPELKARLTQLVLPGIQSLVGPTAFKRFSDSATQNITDVLNSQLSWLSSFLIDKVTSSTRFVITAFATVFLSPIFAFFVMRDFRRLLLRVLLVVPPDLRVSFLKFIDRTDNTLQAVLRGQLLVITTLSVLYGLGLYFAGLPAGLIVGLAAGLSKLVPYLDLAVGGILCAVILLVNDMPSQTVIAVCSVFLFIQAFDGIILTPRIMGKFLGLHPLIIILSVLCFGDWFGFYGVFFAIPIAAVLRVAIVSMFETYKSSRFYRNR